MAAEIGVVVCHGQYFSSSGTSGRPKSWGQRAMLSVRGFPLTDFRLPGRRYFGRNLMGVGSCGLTTTTTQQAHGGRGRQASPGLGQ